MREKELGMGLRSLLKFGLQNPDGRVPTVASLNLERILATVTCAHVWGQLALLEPQEP
ncbi:hypothetical protein [Paenibacillus periandrae]|uniref:hypothetical protein n=1 Tax=Paenibacillus periandrae TaxID=1761741 RepID=UPI001F09ACBD|nr:hypothetical protein [Paenibacillus periandrae]